MSELKLQRTYLTGVKQWKVRNMIEGYLHARQTFQESRRGRLINRSLPSFADLKKVCDELYTVKEDIHLIFRRMDDSEGGNGHHKLVPGYAETAFIDHIGLLFHKAMVAKELRYILEHYAHEERNWEAHCQELTNNLQRIADLFEDGVNIVIDLIRSHSDNVLLLSFLLQHHRLVGRCVKIPPSKLIQELVTKVSAAQAFHLVAEYYFASGWYELAAKAVKKTLAFDPNNETAVQLLHQVEKKLARRNGRPAEEELSAPSEIAPMTET